MTDRHLPRMMGSAVQTTPFKIAERAITLASKASKTSKERFMLQMGADRRVWMERFSAGEIVLGRYRKGHGFCETCQQVKPRKGKSMKGWKCRECRGAA